MGEKISIGLRGWRFDREAVFTDEGDLRPVEDMDDETRTRLVRLTVLVGSPCDACWLVYGDENLSACNVSGVVYGEPFGEVSVCDDHETDFVYWFREAGGLAYRGDTELKDAFHEWFDDGGRAPDGYVGVEHVDTDPEDLPEPPETEFDDTVPMPSDEYQHIDLREDDD